MSGSLTVKTNIDLDFESIGKRSVYVGYPEGPNHAESDITNAELAFIMTSGAKKSNASLIQKYLIRPFDIYMLSRGDPLQRIPPRPFVEPGIERGLDQITEYLKASIQLDLEGKHELAEQERIKAGMAGENAIRKFIREYPGNGLIPNAPSTIRRKGEDHPLKGKTGELMRSVTSVIRND